MKAISSEGKLPFGIGGIKVSVAKIGGKVLTETLYINRQRSGNMYDLINDNGDIYEKVLMRWYDTRGIDIPNTVEPADAINMVQDNSFMIYVDDGISMGYTTLYMGRIIKLNNGRLVKRDYTTPVDGVIISPKVVALNVGGTQQLSSTLIPASATDKVVSYSSSAPTIVEVDAQTGIAIARANGNANVTVTTADGNKTAVCAVTVNIPVPVTTINVTPATKTLTAVNATQAMAAEVLPANATNKVVTWSSSAPAVAKVDASTGVVTALTNGTANIIATATDGSGKTGQGVITVAIPVPVTAIDVTPKAQTLTTLNATQQMTAAITPSTATNKTVTWTSSAPAIAKVDASTGIVTALTNGTANIIATAADGSGVTGQTSVTVNIPVPVTGVTVSPTSATLTSVGATQQLTPTVAPTNATNKAVTYSTSAAGVATVSTSGLITAVANGTANITVTTTDGNKTAVCAVTVNIPVPVSSVSLTPKSTELSLSGTKTVQLVPEVLPTNATNKAVTYSANEPTKVSISADGLVTALEEGTVVITVTTADGSKTDTATVTIIA